MDEIWMLWLFFVLLGAAAVWGAIAGEISHGKRLRQRALGQFGKRPEEEYPLEEIPAFAALDTDAPVDATTWEDLEMDRVFRRVNSCQSAVGEQVLYWQLHRLEPMPQWERLLSHLQANPKEREELWFLLARMGKRRSHYGLPNFLFCPVEVSLSLGALYPLFALLPLAGILLLPWNLWAGGSVILCALGWNLVLYYLGKSRIQGDLEHLRSFSALLWVAEELGKTCSFPPVQQKLRQASQAFHGMKGRLAVLGPRGTSELEVLQ